MDLKLYYAPVSFYSQKVRLALEEKKIPHETVLVNLRFAENETPWYIKTVNPLGQVPAIRHGETRVYDSNKIIQYLDEKFGGKPIYPDAKTAEGEKIDEFIKQHEAIRIDVLTFGVRAYPELAIDQQESEEFTQRAKGVVKRRALTHKLKQGLKQYPELKEYFEEKLISAGKFEEELQDPNNVKREIENGKKFFGYVEQLLQQNVGEGNTYQNLHGDHVNLADIILAVTLQRTVFLGVSKLMWDDGKHSNVEKYYQRLRTQQIFQDVCVKGYGP